MKLTIISFILIYIFLLVGCSEYAPVEQSDPFIEIISPLINSTVSDSTTIKISTNIANLIRVELYIDHSIPDENAIFEKSP